MPSPHGLEKRRPTCLQGEGLRAELAPGPVRSRGPPILPAQDRSRSRRRRPRRAGSQRLTPLEVHLLQRLLHAGHGTGARTAGPPVDARTCSRHGCSSGPARQLSDAHSGSAAGTEGRTGGRTDAAPRPQPRIRPLRVRRSPPSPTHLPKSDQSSIRSLARELIVVAGRDLGRPGAAGHGHARASEAKRRAAAGGAGRWKPGSRELGGPAGLGRVGRRRC